jgi:formylglycine-generating enzyme required for sulfatase activity
MTIRWLLLAVVFTGIALADATLAVEIETVLIGDPANPSDHLSTFNNQENLLFGWVPHEYRIGKYEVTNGQYVEFLNKVAASDPHQLYNDLMDGGAWGGISRSGVSGSYSYAVRQNMGNKPVNFVSFWDAARFVNWLHNGQPTSAENSLATEYGTYDLGGVTNPDNEGVVRSAGAKWFLPTENEWYKAAYFDPRDEAQGGPPGNDHYWDYATQSDTPPTPATASSNGDISNPGPNVANYANAAYWRGQMGVGDVTTVGSAGLLSASYYGTFDQSGNVDEWNEAITLPGGFRGRRGGAWGTIVGGMTAAFRGHYYGASGESAGGGFRVARGVPEPPTAVIVLVAAAAAVWRRRFLQ